MIPAELGCYTSHYKAWEEFIASDADQLIVMEDDVLVDWTIIARLARHSISRFQIDILRMFATHPFSSVIAAYRFMSPHCHLVRCTGQILGTQCYMLTRRGAEALLKAGTVIERPVDLLMSQSWEHGLPNFCLFPLERDVKTSIAGEHQAFPLTLQQRAGRLAWRSKHKLMQQVTNRRHARAYRFKVRADTGPSLLD